MQHTVSKGSDFSFGPVRTMTRNPLILMAFFCLAFSLGMPGPARAQTAEALMDRYNSQCSKEALESLRKQGDAVLKDRGRSCSILARDIQAQTGQLKKKDPQPLAKPDLGAPPR